MLSIPWREDPQITIPPPPRKKIWAGFSLPPLPNLLKFIPKNVISYRLAVLAGLTVSACFFMFYLSLGETLAYFTDVSTKQEIVNSGQVAVQLIEDAPFDGATAIGEYGVPLTTRKKTFRLKAIGKTPTYVRVRIEPLVEFKDSQTNLWYTAPISSDDIVYLLDYSTADWAYQAPYYYYQTPIASDSAAITTSDFSVKVVNLVDVPAEIREMPLRADIKIYVESAQATNNAWKNIFSLNTYPTP